MNFSGAQLEEAESMASLFFSVEDIMTALEIEPSDQEDFRDIVLYQNSHPLFKAYHGGRLTADIELRTSIKMAALNGSNPAQTAMLNYFNQSRL
jgi:hypothetical protein